MKKVTFSVIFLGLLAFASCKKESSSTSRGQLILGTWKGIFMANDDNNNDALDESEKVPFTDTFSMTFYAGGNGRVFFTYPSGSTIYAINWRLQSNDQQLVITAGGGDDTARIYSLNTHELITEFQGSSWVGYSK